MSKREKKFICGPIFTKFGTEVSCGTLTTGKILKSGYHDKGCYGDQKSFSQLKYIT